MLPLTFIYDGLLLLTAIILAFRYLKVWWAYIVAGELIAVFGLSMIFHYFYSITDNVSGASWYSLYAMSQGIVLFVLLFSMAKRRFLIIYGMSGLIAVITGILVSNGHFSAMGVYPVLIGLADLCKVGFMASYWYFFVRGRDCTGYNRIHIWQA